MILIRRQLCFCENNAIEYNTKNQIHTHSRNARQANKQTARDLFFAFISSLSDMPCDECVYIFQNEKFTHFMPIITIIYIHLLTIHLLASAASQRQTATIKRAFFSSTSSSFCNSFLVVSLGNIFHSLKNTPKYEDEEAKNSFSFLSQQLLRSVCVQESEIKMPEIALFIVCV